MIRNLDVILLSERILIDIEYVRERNFLVLLYFCVIDYKGFIYKWYVDREVFFCYKRLLKNL